MPLYGKVGTIWAEASGVEFGHLPLWFLAAHGLVLILAGHLLDRFPARARQGACFSLAAAALLTLTLPALPAGRWWVWFAAAGAVTAPGMVVWGRWYATRVDPAVWGRVFGLAAAAISAIGWLFLLVIEATSPLGALFLTLLPLGAAALALRSGQWPAERHRAASGDWRSLGTKQILQVLFYALFIIAFSVTAGLSYRFLVAEPITPAADETLRRLPYILGVLLAGLLADRSNLRTVMTVGSALLAIAYLIGGLGSGALTHAGVVMNGAAFGLLESAPWLLLAASATAQTAGRWFGYGLNLNVLPIFVGAAIPLGPGSLSPERLAILAALVIVVAILSLQAAADPLERFHHPTPESPVQPAPERPVPPAPEEPEAHPSTPAVAGVDTELLARHFGQSLTERELEVGQLAIQGVPTRSIAAQIFLSENTVKTHLRNVYRKTGSASRHDLFLKLIELEQQSLREAETGVGVGK